MDDRCRYEKVISLTSFLHYTVFRHWQVIIDLKENKWNARFTDQCDKNSYPDYSNIYLEQRIYIFLPNWLTLLVVFFYNTKSFLLNRIQGITKFFSEATD